MNDKQLTINNHYVPECYLKRWIPKGEDGIWTYRLLVSHENVPKWENKKLRSSATQEHLYTRLKNDYEITDEIERRFDTEYETLAAPVIDKVISESRMLPEDWDILANFFILQSLRTPFFLSNCLDFGEQNAESIIKKVLDEIVAENGYSSIKNKDLRIKSYFSMRLSETNGECTTKYLLGREFWLNIVEYLLPKYTQSIKNEKWTIIKAPKNFKWITSDNPSVVAKPNNNKRSNLKPFAPETELILPLSPYHLLYSIIGEKSQKRGYTASIEEACSIQGQLSKNAFRYIFSYNKDEIIEKKRPRTVDASLYESEKKEWQDWHLNNVKEDKNLGCE